MIRILIVEDSQVVALLLKALLEQEVDITVVGHAKNGQEAVEMVKTLRPDLITLDIRMPIMDGFEATRLIMSTRPTPIVVVSSSVDDEELSITFRAIEEGALAVIEKPRGMHHPDFNAIRSHLIDTIRAMSEIKLVRRYLHRRPTSPTPPAITPPHVAPHPFAPPISGFFKMVALACSTGGPQALHHIFSNLPGDLPFPVLVVQHISPGFVGGLCSWLDGASQLRVKLAEEGEVPLPGTVLIAPDSYHMVLKRDLSGLSIALNATPPVNGFRPSASPLFRSLAEHLPGQSVGGILTGMGHDGAEGLLAMHRAGCHTFAEDEKSAIVYGMPAEALAIGATKTALPLESIASHLESLIK
ncbi:MAG: chemotaxis-specific protein-glutamate methyltransferase CheB [Magnetococcales bacterium]|nr:chemotaxis-specific protein-glutamate methyltransferase CheB [Magnetococcales bacterium]